MSCEVPYTEDWISRLREDATDIRVQYAPDEVGDIPKELHFYPRSFAYEVCPKGGGSFVKMYGSDLYANTVAIKAKNYYPYCFVRAFDASQQQLTSFVSQLNGILKILALQSQNGSIGRQARLAVQRGYDPIVQVDSEDCISLKPTGDDRGFNGNRPETFLRMYFYAPCYVTVARNVLEAAFHYDGPPETPMFLDYIVNAIKRKKVDDTEVAAQPLKLQRTETGQKRITKIPDGFSAIGTTGTLFDFEGFSERQAGQQSIAMKEEGDGEGEGEEEEEEEAVDEEGRKRSRDAYAAPVEDDNPWEDFNLDIVYDDIESDNNNLYRATIVQCHIDITTNKYLVDAFEEFDNHVHSGAPCQLIPGRETQVYEADLDFTIRYSIDAGIKAEECVFYMGSALTEPFCESSTRLNQVEFACDWKDLCRGPEKYQDRVPPQVCLSFDCEMKLGPNGAFPKPETEPVIQICCVVFDPIADRECAKVQRRAFVLGTVLLPEDSDLAPYEIYAFKDEHVMLEAFSSFVSRLMPDMMTGWNMENFDMSYLIERAKILNMSHFNSMCRKPGANLRSNERTFQSSAHGTHVYKEVVGEGLWICDLFQSFKRSTSYKFRSYSLEYVSNKLLGDHKEVVPYKAINGLHASASGRYTLTVYCMKDAILPARLMGREMLLLGSIEMARAAGIPIDMISRRGMQIRAKAYLYRKARYEVQRYLLYTRSNADRAKSMGKYDGAHVETPVIGLHDQVVVTLDFTSLYPSIMRTKNMCISTLLPGRALEKRKREHAFTEDQVWKPERNALEGTEEDQPSYLKATKLEGLIPRILQEQLDMRKKVKEMMAEAEKSGDEVLEAIYDKRQLAIKLNCNSIYGIFGAPSSFIYCPELAAMVTATGRDMILETKRQVEAKFKRINGYKFDAQVVYGDTDSVFVELVTPNDEPDITMEESAVFGKEMAEFITDFFRDVYGWRVDNIIELKFEKSFSKIIFYAKKRYVGWKWVLKFDEALGRKILKRKPEPDASGMETERRDSTLLVSKGVKDVIRILLADDGTREEKKDKSRDYILHEMIDPVRRGTVDWSQLIQSKQFRNRAEDYVSKGRKPPNHIQLAAKQEKRLGPGAPGTSEPGDRVQYVVVAGEHAAQKTSECAEDPNYAWEHNLKLSETHYIDNCIMKTMARIMDPIIAPDLIEFNATTRDKIVKRKFTAFLEKGETGGGKRKRAYTPSVARAEEGGLFAFAQSIEVRCLLCGVPGEEICGKHSVDEVGEYRGAKRAHIEILEEEKDIFWKTCHACGLGWKYDDPKNIERHKELPHVPDIESIEVAKPCSSMDCEVYWQRRINDDLRGYRKP